MSLFKKELSNSYYWIALPLSGGYSGGVPPVPIPNTVVKPACADNTRGETFREDRSLPE